MPVSKSDNAIMAKVHALYGKRLKAEDYGKLLQKRTLAEIAGFLKHETYYAEALSAVKEDLVHREQLELMVRRRELDIYVKLRKYSRGNDIFFKMYKMKNEIMQLLFAMRLLNADAMKEFIISLPVYLTKHLSFDLFKVAKAKDYDDLLETLRHTEYYDIIGKFRPVTRDKLIDIPACETALLTHYYSGLLKSVADGYPESTGKYLRRILHYQIDFHNVSMIFRMKRYFGATEPMIVKYLIPIKAGLSNMAYKDLIEARDIHEVGEVLKRYRISKLYPDDITIASERVTFYAEKSRTLMSQRIFRLSNKPMASVICYMLLLEIEVSNIINIIEGARYRLSPEEIRAMLVI